MASVGYHNTLYWSLSKGSVTSQKSYDPSTWEPGPMVLDTSVNRVSVGVRSVYDQGLGPFVSGPGHGEDEPYVDLRGPVGTPTQKNRVKCLSYAPIFHLFTERISWSRVVSQVEVSVVK